MADKEKCVGKITQIVGAVLDIKFSAGKGTFSTFAVFISNSAFSTTRVQHFQTLPFFAII